MEEASRCGKEGGAAMFVLKGGEQQLLLLLLLLPGGGVEHNILPIDAHVAFLMFPRRSSASGFYCLPHSANSPSFPVSVTPIAQVQAVGASGMLDLYNNYGATSLLRKCSSLTQSPAEEFPLLWIVSALLVFGLLSFVIVAPKRCTYLFQLQACICPHGSSCLLNS